MPEKLASIPERGTSSIQDTMEAASRAPASASDPSARVASAELGSALVLHLAFPQAELCERLRTAVEKAASSNADSMEALRLTVCEFTSALRDKGASPEGVLISLKALINNRSLPLIPPHPSDWSGYQLREQISTWSIKEFFRKETA